MVSKVARAKPRSAILGCALVPVLLGACGVSTHVATHGHLTGTTTKPATPGGRSAVSTGPVHAILKGQNHDPIVNQKWIYTMKVMDAQGRPLRATIDTEFALQGAVVGHDTPPTHLLKNGAYKEALKFPASSLGYPLDLQVVVHTKLGSVTLDWPVTVHK